VHDEVQMPFGGKAGVAEFTELRWITLQTTPRH
jgi:benzaldehyde dehydrogenase (NAD)